MAIKFTERLKTAAGYEAMFPLTIAEQVITDEERQFVSGREKENWSGDSGRMTELDDVQICGGTLTNAGAGWCSFKFPRELDGVPVVTIQPVSADGLVLLSNVTAQGFQYQVRVPATGTYYTAVGAAYTNNNAAQTLMSGFTTTAEAVGLAYVAVYDNA